MVGPRDGAWVAEATGLVDLSGWPAGTQLILRRERPHPGAQLRITDVDGHRIVGMLTLWTLAWRDARATWRPTTLAPSAGSGDLVVVG